MRMRQGMGMGSEGEAKAEVGNAGYGGHGGFGRGQDAKGKGKSTTFNSLSSAHPISTPGREEQSRGLREEKGFDMYTPPTNQRAQLGNAWDGENGSNPKWKGKGKEVEHGFNGNGGSGWNNTHNSHSHPHPQINRAHSNAGPSYHQQSSGVSTIPNTSGWIRVNNPHPQHLSSTSNSTSTFNTATPSQPTNTDLVNFDNSGVGSNPHIDRAPMHSNTMNPNPKLKSEAETREEMKEEMNEKGNAGEKGMEKGLEMEKGKGKAETEAEGEGRISKVEGGGRAGTKTPFFDKQTGGWREVEVVDLCGEE
jgi:hypothetical protein